MTKRIISKLICSAMAATTIASLGMMSAGAAGNYTDSYYETSFNQPDGVSDYYTQTRKKEDYSSSYMRITSSPGYILASAYGSNYELAQSRTSYYRTGCYTYNNHIYDERIDPGQSKRLINTIKENGYSYGCIRVKPTNWFYGNVKGWWSPDSI